MMMLLICLLTPPDASLTLKKDAAVSRNRVYLSDVLDKASYQRLKARGIDNLALSESPDFNRRRTLLRSSVAQALHQVRPNMTLAWKGPSSIMLSRRGSPFSSADLETAVTDWVLSRETGMEGTLHVDQLTYTKLQTIPMGEVVYEVRARTMRTMVGRLGLYVDLMVDGIKHKSMAVNVQTSLETMVARLKTDVSRGVPLGEDDIEWELRRLERIGHAPISAENFDGLRARTQLRAGMVLDQRNVERIPLVERNQSVQVTAQRGNLRVRLKALAMQAGGKGDLIRIKNTDSGQTMQGRVQADGTVLLTL